jgi:hypothetical protein
MRIHSSLNFLHAECVGGGRKKDRVGNRLSDIGEESDDGDVSEKMREMISL